MDTKLYKRLEEAAEKDWETNLYRGVKNLREEDMQLCARNTFILGGEWMFKECGGMTVLHDMRRLIIAQCKEWLKGHLPTPDWYASLDEFIADFEADMNKLWEEQE